MPHNVPTSFGIRPVPNEAECFRYLHQLGYASMQRKQEFFVAFLGRRWAPDWPLMIHERVKVWDWCEEAWRNANETGKRPEFPASTTQVYEGGKF